MLTSPYVKNVANSTCQLDLHSNTFL